MRQLALALVVVVASVGQALGQNAAPATTAPLATVAAPAPAQLTLAEQEVFLRKAKVTRTKGSKKGVTNTERATMSDGSIAHDASIQTIDQSVARFETKAGMELNFRDYWGYNVAAYRLGVMLGLDMIPPSISRRHKGKPASYTWWIDDVIMDEQGRAQTKAQPPDAGYWRAQNDIVRLFDALIANTDRNQGNVLIDKHWKVWMIDHTRAFRLSETPKNPNAIARCEKSLFAKIKALDAASLKAELGEVLTGHEMSALLKRRDAIVARIDSLGPAALFELKRPAAPPALASAK